MPQIVQSSGISHVSSLTGDPNIGTEVVAVVQHNKVYPLSTKSLIPSNNYTERFTMPIVDDFPSDEAGKEQRYKLTQALVMHHEYGFVHV